MEQRTFRILTFPRRNSPTSADEADRSVVAPSTFAVKAEFDSDFNGSRSDDLLAFLKDK